MTIAIPVSLVPQPIDEASDPGNHAFADESHDEALAVGVDRKFKLSPAQLSTELEALKSLFHYATIKSATLRQINGHDFAVIEAEVGSPDGVYFITTAQASHEGVLFNVSYQCNQGLDAHCAARARRVVDSIKLAADPR